MVPPQGKLPAHAILMESGTGKSLRRIFVYSPAVWLLDNDSRIITLNCEPWTDAKAAKKTWALRIYQMGKLEMTVTIEQLYKSAKADFSKIQWEKPTPLGWLLGSKGLSKDTSQLVLTLADGTEVTLKTDTGKVEKTKSLPAGKPHRETALAEGYRAVLQARSLVPEMNRFALKLHDLAAAQAEKDNLVFSPFGLSTTLGALSGVLAPTAGSEISLLLTKKKQSSQWELLGRIHELERLVVPPGNGTPADRLGLKLEKSDKEKEGLIIRSVAPGSPLAKQISPGDRLLQINDSKAASPDRVGKLARQWLGDFSLVIATPNGEIRYLELCSQSNVSHVQSRTVLWTQKGMKWQKGALENLRQKSSLSLREVDFKDPKAAAEQINTEMAPSTGEKFPQIVAANNLSDRYQLMVTNTFSFFGQWVKPFEVMEGKQKFFIGKDKAVEVPFIKLDTKLAHAKLSAPAVTAVEIPYRSRKHALVLLVPENAGDLRKIELSLAKEGLMQIFEKLDASLQAVSLKMPKFELQSSHSFETALTSLGLPKLVQVREGLQESTVKSSMLLKNLRQQAWLKLDEKGTRATSASTAGIAAIGPGDKPVEVNVSHPFLFLIRDRSTSALLFLGRVTDPSIELDAPPTP